MRRAEPRHASRRDSRAEAAEQTNGTCSTAEITGDLEREHRNESSADSELWSPRDEKATDFYEAHSREQLNKLLWRYFLDDQLFVFPDTSPDHGQYRLETMSRNDLRGVIIKVAHVREKKTGKILGKSPVCMTRDTHCSVETIVIGYVHTMNDATESLRSSGSTTDPRRRPLLQPPWRRHRVADARGVLYQTRKGLVETVLNAFAVDETLPRFNDVSALIFF